MKYIKIIVVFLIVGLMVPNLAIAGRPASPKMSPLPVSRGGTGATSAASARTALGVTDSAGATAYVDQSIATHSADNSAQHGCTNVASAAAVAEKAATNGDSTERFAASVFYGGGLGYELTNGDSVTATAGSLVTVTTTSNKFIITTAAGYPDGVLYGDTATDTAGYILTSGIAHNIIVPGNATAGDFLFIDGSTAGAASTSTLPPQTSTETWQYLGRCILTTTTGTTSALINR